MREIETTRLLLRMFAPDDVDDLSCIFSDPDVIRHLGTGLPLPRAETEQALSSIIKHWERHGFGRWAAVFKPTGKLIGYGGLRSFHETPELVYLLAKPYWGIGLATEMAQAALRYGFIEHQFERIIAMAKVANFASQRVMEKLGMSFEKYSTIFQMEVACYSLSRDAYLSEPNPHRDSLAA
jgi:RimJ/RimL family protein N-acetyltransferase